MAPFGTGALPRPVHPSAGGSPPPGADRDAGSASRAASRSRRRGDRRAAWRAALSRPAVFLPLVALWVPPAALSAEGDAAPATAPAPLPAAAREQIPLGAALPLLGRDVKGPSGQVVAQVVNVLVDGSGRPLAAVLDYGGFMGVGRRRIAVAWRALRFAPDEGQEGAITLGLTRDQLKDFPEAKKGEPAVVAAPAAAAPR
jgi:hypothetical protein